MVAQRRDDKEKTEPQQTVVRTLWIYARNQSIQSINKKHPEAAGFDQYYTYSTLTLWDFFTYVSILSLITEKKM